MPVRPGPVCQRPCASAGSLVTLQMSMHLSGVLPDVTVVLYFSDNCMYDNCMYTNNCMYNLSDSALVKHFTTGPLDSITPAWRAWLADDEKPDLGVVPPLNVSIAPALHYQSSNWNPSSLDCRVVAFPLFDWVWPGQVCPWNCLMFRCFPSTVQPAVKM